jgi:translation initiation factor 1
MDIDVQLNEAFTTNFIESKKSKIHIRLQSLGRRCITLIQGLEDDLDLKRISKSMKKLFNCAATIVQGKEDEEIIQLQGDQRENVKNWLLDQEIIPKKEADERILVHGF